MQVCLPGLLQTAGYAQDTYQQYHPQIMATKVTGAISHLMADK
jgi:hypothetical protein